MNFKVILIGVIIFLIGLAGLLLLPLYFPNYSIVNNQYVKHYSTVTIPGNAGKIVLTFNITKANNSIIAFIKSGNANISILNGTYFSHVICNKQSMVSLILSPGCYEMEIINDESTPQNITYTYGIFNAGFITSFYNGLGIITTIMEIIAVGGIALAFISFIYELLSIRRRKK
ncbi:hypothetical protein D1867_05975 [Acidianus infernus]|uniref:Uncharacterized protein n=1 Tax=Acidianus infernus TaxID=12915 RepID=A0A6A9QHT7_ACIIN|nr:hypothetical protein [Acidianus infernus]MUM64800.1 hypothetical protein [Acidianus infernus]